jgi:hypothetical protein
MNNLARVGFQFPSVPDESPKYTIQQKEGGSLQVLRLPLFSALFSTYAIEGYFVGVAINPLQVVLVQAPEP